MLISISIRPGARTRWQKYWRNALHDADISGKRWKEFRDDRRNNKNHFNMVLRPYKPCGLEYAKDTETDFRGVYVSGFPYVENWIETITYNKVIDHLVDYGNADNASQVLAEYASMSARYPERFVGNHIILLQPLLKETHGGYRWHKNGGYIGEAPVCNEYFGDEADDLKMVYQYHVIQVSNPKEEDFGDVEAMNLGRIEGIRKLRVMGLTNLAKLAKQYGYVFVEDSGCTIGDEKTEMYFEFEYDDFDNLIDVVAKDYSYSDKGLPMVPDIDWTK